MEEECEKDFLDIDEIYVGDLMNIVFEMLF